LLYIIAGVVLLLLGLIGLVLPVVPQIPFLLAGAVLLARGSKRVRQRIVESDVYRKYLKGRNIWWIRNEEEDDENSYHSTGRIGRSGRISVLGNQK